MATNQRDCRHRPDRPGRDGGKPRPEHGEPRLHRRRLQPDDVQGRRVRRGPSQGQEDRRHLTRSRSWSPSLKPPRKIMIMVKAGAPVDDVIDELVPLLAAGRHPDRRRQLPFPRLDPADPRPEGQGAALHRHGRLRRRGRGPQGPFDHARRRPRRRGRTSSRSSRPSPPRSPTARPAATGSGPRAPGHYVKMVHNGIEYGDMQLICEAYHLMRELLGMEPAAMHDVFARWNKGPLDSYLIEITRDILGFIDPETGSPMVDLILDAAGQKGTGKWTVISASRPGRAADPDRRGRLRPLPVGPEGRAGRGLQGAQRPCAHPPLRQGIHHRRHRATPSTPARSSPTPRASR